MYVTIVAPVDERCSTWFCDSLVTQTLPSEATARSLAFVTCANTGSEAKVRVFGHTDSSWPTGTELVGDGVGVGAGVGEICVATAVTFTTPDPHADARAPASTTTDSRMPARTRCARATGPRMT